MILFEKKYQAFDTVFHHQMKHLEVRQKYSAARCIFNSLLGVSSGYETLHLMFDILHEKHNYMNRDVQPQVRKHWADFSKSQGSFSLNCTFKININVCVVDDY